VIGVEVIIGVSFGGVGAGKQPTKGRNINRNINTKILLFNITNLLKIFEYFSKKILNLSVFKLYDHPLDVLVPFLALI
jgi:hypothetical protein